MTNLDISAAYVGLDSVDKVYLGSEAIWSSAPPRPEPPLSAAPLTLEVISGGTIWWQRGNGTSVTTAAPYTVIYYSKDFGGTWSPLTASEEMVQGQSCINVNAGDKVQFAGTNNKYDGTALNSPTSNHFAGTAVFNAYGNILSMHDKDNYLELTGFTTSGSRLSNIFYAANVISAENLIFPDFLSELNTYSQMFYGSSLVTPPKILPATALTRSCYTYMFCNCSALTSSPVLPASDVAVFQAYNFMFSGCTSLSSITCLATTWTNQYSANYWVSGVSPTGTFYKHPDMNDWPTGNNGIPSGWTVQDYVAQ